VCLRLAIYDWNGTLFNDLPVAYSAMEYIFHTLVPRLRPPTLEEYRNGITSNFTDFYYRYGIPKTVSGDELNRLRTSHYVKLAANAALNDGAEELLRKCRSIGLKNAMVSASPEDVEKALARFGILHLFDKIRLKAWPKGAALVETVGYFGVAAEEAFYIDDTYDGLRAAKNLGIVAIGFTGGYCSRERILAAQPDYVVDSLREVITILNSIRGARL
jgi:HAD superfamily hydrolase (TIGR01509 family)